MGENLTRTPYPTAAIYNGDAFNGPLGFVLGGPTAQKIQLRPQKEVDSRNNITVVRQHDQPPRLFDYVHCLYSSKIDWKGDGVAFVRRRKQTEEVKAQSPASPASNSGRLRSAEHDAAVPATPSGRTPPEDQKAKTRTGWEDRRSSAGSDVTKKEGQTSSARNSKGSSASAPPLPATPEDQKGDVGPRQEAEQSSKGTRESRKPRSSKQRSARSSAPGPPPTPPPRPSSPPLALAPPEIPHADTREDLRLSADLRDIGEQRSCAPGGARPGPSAESERLADRLRRVEVSQLAEALIDVLRSYGINPAASTAPAAAPAAAVAAAARSPPATLAPALPADPSHQRAVNQTPTAPRVTFQEPAAPSEPAAGRHLSPGSPAGPDVAPEGIIPETPSFAAGVTGTLTVYRIPSPDLPATPIATGEHPARVSSQVRERTDGGAREGSQDDDSEHGLRHRESGGDDEERRDERDRRIRDWEKNCRREQDGESRRRRERGRDRGRRSEQRGVMEGGERRDGAWQRIQERVVLGGRTGPATRSVSV